MESKSAQCDILKDEPKGPEPFKYELSGDYVSNLLGKMNEPDPRDVNFLNQERKKME